MPLSRAFFPRRYGTGLLTAGLLAWLTGACGYPDVDLTRPERLQAPLPAAASATEAADSAEDSFGLGTPFVVIRFGPEPDGFEAPLAEAVTEALAQRPDARFHLLAVAAGAGPDAGPDEGRDTALRHAEAVLRSLAELGVPPDEVVVAAVAAPGRANDEVRLYLR